MEPAGNATAPTIRRNAIGADQNAISHVPTSLCKTVGFAFPSSNPRPAATSQSVLDQVKRGQGASYYLPGWTRLYPARCGWPFPVRSQRNRGYGTSHGPASVSAQARPASPCTGCRPRSADTWTGSPVPPNRWDMSSTTDDAGQPQDCRNAAHAWTPSGRSRPLIQRAPPPRPARLRRLVCQNDQICAPWSTALRQSQTAHNGGSRVSLGYYRWAIAGCRRPPGRGSRPGGA